MRIWIITLGAMFVAATMAAIVQMWRYDAKISKLRMQHAVEAVERSEQASKEIEQQRAQDKATIEALEGTVNDAIQKQGHAADAANRANNERDRLRKRIADLAKAAAEDNPTIADGGPARSKSIDLLAYMLRELSGRASTLAAVADRARIAGLTCEAAYDHLRVDSSSQKTGQ